MVGALALAGCLGTQSRPVTPVPPTPSASSTSSPASPSAAASTSPPAAPTNAGDGEARYSCDDNAARFSLSLFDAPGNAEREGHPAAERLRAALAQREFTIDSFPAGGYWLVARTDDQADYIARATDGDPPFVHATFRMRDGAWNLWAYGECRPTIALDGASLATWILDPAVLVPRGAATSFTALVNERACTGGKPMGGRLLPPLITYGADTISVVFAARPLAGDGHDCPGNPSMRVVVELREPIGGRRLLDGAFFPPADPSAPAS